MGPDGLATPEMVQDRWPLCEVPGNGEYTPGKEGCYAHVLLGSSYVIPMSYLGLPMLYPCPTWVFLCYAHVLLESS